MLFKKVGYYVQTPDYLKLVFSEVKKYKENLTNFSLFILIITLMR